jgi:hypothetical protein
MTTFYKGGQGLVEVGNEVALSLFINRPSLIDNIKINVVAKISKKEIYVFNSLNQVQPMF